MSASPFIEEHVEAEQLQAKIQSLKKENAILREHQSPAAGPLELQAKNIILQREAETLRQSLPEFVPYQGPLPETLEQFGALPASHQRQVLREHPHYFNKLQQAHALVQEAGRRAQCEAQRLAALNGVGVTSMSEFAALAPEQRRALVMKMTPQQRRILLGLPVARGSADQGDWSDQPGRRGYL